MNKSRLLPFTLIVVLGVLIGPLSRAATSPTLPGIYTEIIGNVRVQVLSGTLVRLEVKGPNGFEDRPTFHITNRNDWPGDTVLRLETENLVTLETSNNLIHIPKGAPDLTAIHVTDKTGTVLWHYTNLPENKVALPRFKDDVWAFAIADTPRVVPAEWGFNPQPDWNTQHRESNGWDFSNDAPDLYLFLPQNDHRQLRKDFVHLTGRPELVPLSALGAWDSRYYPYTEETALAQIDGYHGRRLPLDVLVIDTDWRLSTSGMGYDVNTRLFPRIELFFQRAHLRNVLVMFNDHPEPTTTDGSENHALSPTEVAYRSENLQRLLRLGLDGWWYDRNWTKTIIPPDGFTHEVIGMALYADAFRAAYPNRRLFLLSNVDGVVNGVSTGPSNIAAHRYSIQWTGDTSGGQETILSELRNILERGETAALAYVSTDLGGHLTSSHQITDREYLRWVQAGALMPIFRPHVTANDPGRMPWLRGETVTDIYREYLNLRYRLLPVFYQLAWENQQTGLPIARPMTFGWPHHPSAERYDQYMLGEDILVAPVIEQTPLPVPVDWLVSEGAPGLRAEYFPNTHLIGEPVLTTRTESIDYDWGTAAPAPQIPTDYFSARYTGTITNRCDRPVLLGVTSDDGSRLYLDGELVIDRWQPQAATTTFATVVLEPTKPYTLTLEYFDEQHNAVLQLVYKYAESELSKERTVFIPDGAWIDTMTGETVYGPQTVTVQAGLTQMPIYIKKGAVIPLADETLTVRAGDWSHLTLDVYPSTRHADTTLLYEDDTETNAYKEGALRLTLLTAGFTEGTATLTIAAAEGSFSGPRACTEREWTIRVHGPEHWGKLLRATLNGDDVDFARIERDPNAMPLNNKGGATDGDVYVIQFRAPVDQAQHLTFAFENPWDPQ